MFQPFQRLQERARDLLNEYREEFTGISLEMAIWIARTYLRVSDIIVDSIVYGEDLTTVNDRKDSLALSQLPWVDYNLLARKVNAILGKSQHQYLYISRTDVTAPTPIYSLKLRWPIREEL